MVGQVKVTKSYGAEVRELEKFGRHYTNTVDITRPQSRWWHSMDTLRGVLSGMLAPLQRENFLGNAQVLEVFDITKVGSQAWTVGAKVYWDDTNKRCTTVATDNTLIGVAVEAVASGAGDTIGRVRLNATF